MKIGQFILFAAITVIGACSGNNQAIVTGSLSEPGHDYLYLNHVDVDKTELVDSARISRSGKFRFRFDARLPEYYTLGYDNNEFITIIVADGNKINLRFSGSNLNDKYQVSGSYDTEKVRILDKKLSKTISTLDSISLIYKEAKIKGEADSIIIDLEEQYDKIVEDQRRFNISFILENLTSFASIRALYQRFDENTYVLYRPRDIQFLKLVSDSLSFYYPASKQVKSLSANLNRELNGMYMNRISGMLNDMKETDLEADLPDINGRKIKLSSFKGRNYVLLSFWNPDSRDCVSNNLYLKSVYNRYHSKGLEIYQVNVGKDTERWIQAVKFDELPWISVREDDPDYPATAGFFNVSSVPANYLIDLKGEIIGKNLFNRSLQIKLAQIFD